MDIDGETRTIAMISLYSIPDPVLIERSSGALVVCGYEGDPCLVVLDVKAIQSVVAMVPFTQDDRMMENPDQYFVVEKPGLNFATR